jgi:hypothetical protein
LRVRLNQIEAAGLHRLPHPGGPAGSVEQLTPEEVGLQLLVRHHAQIALTRHGEDCRSRDHVVGEMLKLDPIMLETQAGGGVT